MNWNKLYSGNKDKESPMKSDCQSFSMDEEVIK